MFLIKCSQKIFGLGFALALISCANSDAVSAGTEGKVKASDTTIIGARMEAGKIVIRVPSRGCTLKAHFDVKVEDLDGKAGVSFSRNKPDYCKALVKNGIEIEFTLEELKLAGSKKVVVLNPLSR